MIAWQWVRSSGRHCRLWASTRDSAAGAWSTPARIAHAESAFPLAAGVGPDGTTYVEYSQVAAQMAENGIGVVRRPAGGGWGAPTPLRSNISAGGVGGIAFAGADAVFAWESIDNGTIATRIQAARWAAGAPAPEAPRDLDQPDAGTGLAAITSDRRGGVVAQWDGPHPRFAALDGGGPELTSSNVPADAVAGQPVGASASFADMWSAIPAAPTWDFGDGSAPAGGDAVSHVYTQAGTYTVTVRAADALANQTTKTFTASRGSRFDRPPPAPAPAAAPDPTTGTDVARPTVTLKLPGCRSGETKRSCARRRHTTTAWRVLHGAVRDATPSSGIARVEVAITRLRNGRATTALRYRAASVKGATWSHNAGRLRRGAYVFRVRAFDRAGSVSATVARRVRLI